MPGKCAAQPRLDFVNHSNSFVPPVGIADKSDPSRPLVGRASVFTDLGRDTSV
jgi:hypothetical protein